MRSRRAWALRAACSTSSGGSRRCRSCSAALLVAFATLLYLGPDVEQRKWQFLTPGSLVAALLWIAISGLFAVYTSTFGSYNKTWGTLSAVIVTLTWLWLSAMALLYGAEVNAELERTAARGDGEPAPAPRERRGRKLVERTDCLLVAQEAQQEVRERGEEDDRLLDRHRHARDLLVDERAGPPRSRRVRVERVDRPRDQREQQAERRGEHERREQVGGLRAGRERAVDHGPPHGDPGREIHHVLDVQQRVRVTQRVVVDPGQMPDEVRRDPQRQRDERAEEHEAASARCERRRDGEHEQRRRPLGEHDVLQQVRPEERVQRERLQLA